MRRLLLRYERDGVVYTLTPAACGVWRERGREVRCAVVHCDDRTRWSGPRTAWAVTVRLEDCCRVAAHDEHARQLPVEVEGRVVHLLRSASV